MPGDMWVTITRLSGKADQAREYPAAAGWPGYGALAVRRDRNQPIPGSSWLAMNDPRTVTRISSAWARHVQTVSPAASPVQSTPLPAPLVR
jgi:hypothetical protein